MTTIVPSSARRDSAVVLSAIASAALIASGAGAADLQLIYSEILSSPTSTVPGALDLAGAPVATTWSSLAVPGLSVQITGDQWVLRGVTAQPTDQSTILMRGTGTTGTMFLQEAQPLQGGGGVGEVYDFFDNPPVHFNSAGQMAYSFRARGGVTTDNEKVATFIGSTHSIVLQQGSSLSGLESISGTIACTNPTLGNSVGAVHMLESGEVAFGNTPITGCSSFLYPALFIGHSAIMQNGITPILTGKVGEEVISDGGFFDEAAISPDGAHWLVPTDTNNPDGDADGILLLDNAAIMRENELIPGASVDMVTVSKVWYAPNSDWYARGTSSTSTYPAPAGVDDWAVRNGTLIARSGDNLFSGASERWGDVLLAFFGNSEGKWILAGNTDNPNANLNTVIVLNGEEVVVREGDPVDVNGNGQFDDDAFINTIIGNAVFLTDASVLYFQCTLRNAGGTNIGDAFIRADLAEECVADINGSDTVDVLDLLAVITSWGPCPDCPATPCDADIAPARTDCTVNVLDLLAVITNWGACP